MPRRSSQRSAGHAVANPVNMPTWSIHGSELHDDGLGVGEELTTETAALTSDAGVADPAEGRPQVADEEAVDPDRARPKGTRDPVGPREVLGEDHGIEPVRRVVGDADRLVF